jgi:hypothetical protein
MKQELEFHWHRCKPYIQDALDAAGNLFILSDVWALVESGKAQFWPGFECAVVTEVNDYPQKRVLNVWLGGGKLEEILTMEPHIRQFAKNSACELILIQGRPGWRKIFKMKQIGVILCSEV